jgi:phosphodiesterase/alkaline phosphatase D-like protein
MEYAGLSSSYFQTWDHHVVIEDLEPKTRYFYRVGNEQDGWSQEFSFVTASNDLSDPIRAVVIGDMGIFNSEDTIAALTGLVDSDSVDMILHVGDISYADDSFLKHPFEFGYEKVWNSYMQSIQQFAARVPYMTLPGNHEAECHSPACFISEDKLNKLSNFSAYNNRFRMPSAESGGALNMWYSFNLGPVHFINLDTETDFEGLSPQ